MCLDRNHVSDDMDGSSLVPGLLQVLLKQLRLPANDSS